MSRGLPGKIFIDMRTDIIMGAYPIGSKLPPERELVQKYQASRFAIREAIAMLAQSGFVVTHPQSGTYVKDFNREGSLETLVQILHIRKSIDRETLESLLKFRFVTETEAAGEATRRVTPSDIERLEANLARKRDHLTDIAILTECDYDFHGTIIAISGDIISRLIFQAFKPVYSFFTAYFYTIGGAPEKSLALNQKLVQALKRRNEAAARKAMAAILKSAEKSVYAALHDAKSSMIRLS